MDFGFFISVVISIFVMADPFGNIPIFLGLTGGMSGTERRYVITKASVIARRHPRHFRPRGEAVYGRAADLDQSYGLRAAYCYY